MCREAGEEKRSRYDKDSLIDSFEFEKSAEYRAEYRKMDELANDCADEMNMI